MPAACRCGSASIGKLCIISKQAVLLCGFMFGLGGHELISDPIRLFLADSANSCCNEVHVQQKSLAFTKQPFGLS